MKISSILFSDNIELGVVITKCDLVEGFNTSEKTSESNIIKQHQFKRMENKVAKEFSIGGAMEHNSIRWQSYVDGRCLDDPYIDNKALKFVRQMMQPRRRRHPVESDKTPVLTPQKMLLFKLTKAVNEMNADQIFSFWSIFWLLWLECTCCCHKPFRQLIRKPDNNGIRFANILCFANTS
ncbi:hypothetical protein DPMN_154666 [Dreissena polymorpha]|uniref:Uncharacterized protein n=1 Tax=Dreissena polymorpha TaxID=45954 RepID=A0A9D4JAL5_DREPO|nr:hypothetical protein DPMN_154666 [Dreissena polymorpha]